MAVSALGMSVQALPHAGSFAGVMSAGRSKKPISSASANSPATAAASIVFERAPVCATKRSPSNWTRPSPHTVTVYIGQAPKQGPRVIEI